MVQVKVRVSDGTYDILFLGASKAEAMAVREGFSALEVNQDWAFENQGTLTYGVRNNSVLADLHDEYKRTIRDVAPAQQEKADEFADFVD